MLGLGTGLVTVIVSTYLQHRVAMKRLNLQATVQYFQQGDTREFIECRYRIRKADASKIDPVDAAAICSFFHFWGLMVRKNLLPIWVFDGVSGQRVVQFYQKLSTFIEDNRKDASRYAEHFQWLKEEIIRRGYAE